MRHADPASGSQTARGSLHGRGLFYREVGALGRLLLVAVDFLEFSIDHIGITGRV